MTISEAYARLTNHDGLYPHISMGNRRQIAYLLYSMERQIQKMRSCDKCLHFTSANEKICKGCLPGYKNWQWEG
jgi:recombinational DNA repair protein RecR